MIFGLPLDLLLMRATTLLVVVAAHGFAVAFVADRLGDPGPRRAGRVSANALRHLEFIGTLALIFSGGYGWIRPILIDRTRLRFGRLGLLLVLVAGLVAALAVAALFALARLAVGDSEGGAILADTLEVGVTVAVAFAVFNAIPLPPLTGGLLLAALVPPLHRWLAERAIFPALLLALLLAGNVVQDALAPTVAEIVAVLPGDGAPRPPLPIP